MLKKSSTLMEPMKMNPHFSQIIQKPGAENLIIEFCRRHHVKRLALFGSILREDFRSNSDVDVLVEFKRGFTPGLSFFDMEAELSNIFGRKVDLNTPKFLSSYFRQEVLREAEVVFDAT